MSKGNKPCLALFVNVIDVILYSYTKMKFMVLMRILRCIFLLMYLLIICLCVFINVGFVFYGREYLAFSSVHIHLYIFILVEFFNWHFGSIFVNIKFRSLPK